VTRFQVRVQSTGYGYQLNVDGVDNAQWLLDRLGQSFVFRSAKPIAHALSGPQCTFEVVSGPLLSYDAFLKLLANIPEVLALKAAARTEESLGNRQ
jgi:hypothetical protein